MSHAGTPAPSLLVLHPGAPQRHSQIFPTGVGGTGGLGAAHYSYYQAGSPALPHIIEIIIDRGNRVPTAPQTISGFADHVGRRSVEAAALIDAVDSSLTPPAYRKDQRGAGWIFVGAEAIVILDAHGVVLAARPRPSLLGERNGQIVRRLVEILAQLRRTGEPRGAEADTAEGRPGSGASPLAVAPLGLVLTPNGSSSGVTVPSGANLADLPPRGSGGGPDWGAPFDAVSSPLVLAGMAAVVAIGLVVHGVLVVRAWTACVVRSGPRLGPGRGGSQARGRRRGGGRFCGGGVGSACWWAGTGGAGAGAGSAGAGSAGCAAAPDGRGGG